MSSFNGSFFVDTHDGQPVNQTDGAIELDYTLSTPGGSITNASFTYSNGASQGPFAVTFTGPDGSGNYSGSCSMPGGLTIPNESGTYLSGSLSFNPTANTLSGDFVTTAIGGPPGDDDVTWEAKGSGQVTDALVQRPAEDECGEREEKREENEREEKSRAYGTY